MRAVCTEVPLDERLESVLGNLVPRTGVFKPSMIFDREIRYVLSTHSEAAAIVMLARTRTEAACGFGHELITAAIWR
jgi:hypothetical protein